MYFRLTYYNFNSAILVKRTLMLMLTLLSTSAFAQYKTLTGILISDDNASVIQLASVQNTRSGKKAVSNRQGVFRIPVQPGDSIRISSVGFERLWLSADELMPDSETDTVLIMMHNETYNLNDVTVVFSNRRRDSIARVVAEFMKTDKLLNNNDRILKRPRGSGFSGVLTEMYYEFSKAGQDMVKFEAFVKYYRQQQEVDRKYNKDVVKRVTRLDDFYLDDFMMFCKLERQFVINAADYDLYKAISDCGTQFRQKYGLRD